MKQEFVYVLYSIKSPYLPIDIADGLSEISLRYNIPIKTLRNYCHDETHVFRKTFTLCKVILADGYYK